MLKHIYIKKEGTEIS